MIRSDDTLYPKSGTKELIHKTSLVVFSKQIYHQKRIQLSIESGFTPQK
jgi:hypothetical protein